MNKYTQTHNASKRKGKVKLRSIVLPPEHGAWSFLFEPILLGLLVAGSWQGLLLSLAALGIFLLHQPVKIALNDRRKGQRRQRSVVAERFALGFGLLSLVSVLALLQMVPATFLLPALCALPFAFVEIYYDARNQSRKLIPEVCAAVALSAVAASLAILAGLAGSQPCLGWIDGTSHKGPSPLVGGCEFTFFVCSSGSRVVTMAQASVRQKHRF